MKKLLIIIGLTCVLPIYIFGQNHYNKINVGDTSVFLLDVDLEKGLSISDIFYEQKHSDLISKKYTIKKRIFTNPTYNVYAIVEDTIIVENDSRYATTCTDIKLYNIEGDFLFSKHFEQLSLFRVYISENSKITTLYLFNEEGETIQSYKSDGTLLKEYDNDKGMFYYSIMHNHFFVCNNNILNGPNSFDLINKEGQIQEIIFPTGNFRGITFSPNENYYIALINGDQYLFSINNSLIWKLPYTYGNVNILSGDNKYIVLNPNTNELEIKNLINHNLTKTIPNVSNKSNTFPILVYYIKDTYFYTIAKTTKEYIFNFFTLNGELVDIQTKPNNIPYYKYKVEYNYNSKTYIIR